MNAILLSIGDELVSGQTVDTNSAYLARQLAMRGIRASEHWTVGDDLAAIRDAITQAAAHAELVLVTGGLGPTADDLTRQALADAMGTPLQLDAACLAEIEAYFKTRGWTMVETNKVQAQVPAGARAITNKVGTAPGLAARVGEARVFVTPGVPHEMRWMFENAIAPELGSESGVVLHRVVHTFGMGESSVGEKIADLMRRGNNPTVGTTVAAGLVSIRVVTQATSKEQAQADSQKVIDELHRRLGTLIVAEDEGTMATALGELLRRDNATLATAESCTGGMMGQMLTAVPGSSDYYLGGVVSYANAVKRDLLGVDPSLLEQHGAVSDPVAAAMAAGCRERLGATWALSATGIAGPGGATESKPVGLVYVGLAGPGGVETVRLVLPGTREIVRLRACLAAMNLLRLKLLR